MKRNPIWLLLFSVAALAINPELGFSEVSAASYSEKYFIDSKSQQISQPKHGLDKFLPQLSFKQKPILLTFDDGPDDPEIDLAILAILKKHSAKSIWFVNCKHLDPAANSNFQASRDTLKEITSAGHLIGNHGYHHLNLKNLDRDDPQKMHQEISECSSYIKNLTGSRPAYFRAPWGERSENVTNFALEQGMASLYWTVNSMDMVQSNKSRVIDSVKAYVDNLKIERGDVILFHDHTSTLRMLDKMLTKLDSEGFIYVTPG
ncbi:polysaccharide deacetylase family protein [Undibacterium terreum]|uniref:NodB homology domain-containing protein n=1 Tax=Undibacterium terreum TaxID=1224302 RepID=A0A916X9R6_9BURK|nr:polysaccharide deacetylase family protein [Undibacterium terreum]GGC57643.1 hypothetical protein GCM10011396_00610 [Undibacterium terreum]